MKIYDEIVQLYLSGISRIQLMKKYNLPMYVIYQAIKRRGIKVWDRINKYRPETLEKVVQMLKEGKDLKLIVQKFNLDYRYLIQMCRNNNIEIKTTKEVNLEKVRIRRQKVEKLFKKGYSLNKIAEKLNIKRTAVYSDLRALGYCTTKKIEKESKSKYYHWKDDNSNYAKLFYEYNK